MTPLSKSELRIQVREKRARLAASIPDHAEQLARYTEALRIPANSLIGAYAVLPGEADPRLLLKQLTMRGCTLAFPRVTAKDAPLVFHHWKSGHELRRGAYGVPEPSADWPVAHPRTMLVPLLAFDDEGYRLGYGGGFYDRTLRKLRETATITAIGVAYDGQRIAHLPHDNRDEKLDFVVTEKGVRTFV